MDQDGHINLFKPELLQNEPNTENQKEKDDEQSKWEQKVGILRKFGCNSVNNSQSNFKILLGCQSNCYKLKQPVLGVSNISTE